MSHKTVYKIIFAYQDVVFEIYARSLKESEMFGFIEVQEFVFGEQTALVVDPSEERLKLEFSNVKRTLIPMQSVYRIDEVTQQGTAKVKDRNGHDSKITPFPGKSKIKE